MKSDLKLSILPQPDDTTCGPTCLHAVYRYFGETVELDEIINEVTTLDSGGTLAVYLACHALRRGYSASLFTYNLHFFDPTWFRLSQYELRAKLLAQATLKKDDQRLHAAARGYIDFLTLGGTLHFEDLSRNLIRGPLRKSLPVITGLSSTYLYRAMREYGPHGQDDDLRGEPTGHFVVLSGYDTEERTIDVADPYHKNPVSTDHHYSIHIDRVISAILLGVLTHDANFLIIKPPTHLKKVSAHGENPHSEPLPQNRKRLQGAPDARTLFNGLVRWPVKRPAKCASAHEQADDKADGAPCDRLLKKAYRADSHRSQ